MLVTLEKLTVPKNTLMHFTYVYRIMITIPLQAGITSEGHPERLLIALEPEVASIYVRKLRLYQLVPDTPVTQSLPRSGGAPAANRNRYSYYGADANTASGNNIRLWSCVCCECIIYKVAQNMHIFSYALTLSNVDKFSNLFHCKDQENSYNNTVTKDLITPQVCRYTAL